MNQPGTSCYEFGEFRVDIGRRILLQAGNTIALTPRQFDTLLYLVEHCDRVITKEELMKAIWSDAFVEENNLNQSVSAIRRALGERRGDNRYIITVPGVGYRFAAPVKLVSSVEHRAARGSLAVLPFKPLLEKERDEALELGMADSLIIRLSNSRDMIVRPLTSVRRFSGLEQDAQSAGRELDVESVLDGSIQRAGARIRLTARLTDVADGRSLWVGTFDEEFTDVFSVQDAISERVAGALQMHLGAEKKRHTVSTRAYELYLQGRYHWSRLVPTEVRKSIEFYEQAIAVDPNYALAYTGIAVAYVSLSIASDAKPAESFPKAKAAALKAVTLDESLSDAHAYLSFIHFWFDWDWAAAESEVRRAIALNANSAEAHRGYGILLSQLGRQDEAIVEGTRARELDPLALITRTNEALFFYYSNQLPVAEDKLRAALELEPNFWIALLSIAKVYVAQGRYREAIAELTKARKLSGGSAQPLSMLGYTFAIMGDREGAFEVLNELETLAGKRYVPPYNSALVYNGLHDDDNTFEWLERAYAGRDVLLAAFIKTDPVWSRLYHDPRFQDLLARMNL
ncbi:MAG TPA: winged helix-turn-helix domain-containing protein [Pyrinomonadaceae bacterium]|nr:winged helix-turn-helix domain-containing protein [Pyrinomonadaceae bacterium]